MITLSIDTCTGIQEYKKSDLENISDWLDGRKEIFNLILSNGFIPYKSKSQKMIYLMPKGEYQEPMKVIVASNGWPDIMKINPKTSRCLDTNLLLTKIKTSSEMSFNPLKIYHSILLEISRSRELHTSEIISSENLEFNPFGESRRIYPEVEQIKNSDYRLYYPTHEGESLNHKLFVLPKKITSKPNNVFKVMCIDSFSSKPTSIRAIDNGGFESLYYNAPIYPVENLTEIDEDVLKNAEKFIRDQTCLEFHP